VSENMCCIYSSSPRQALILFRLSNLRVIHFSDYLWQDRSGFKYKEGDSITVGS